jgi:hypothetical protein
LYLPPDEGEDGDVSAQEERDGSGHKEEGGVGEQDASAGTDSRKERRAATRTVANVDTGSPEERKGKAKFGERRLKGKGKPDRLESSNAKSADFSGAELADFSNTESVGEESTGLDEGSDESSSDDSDEEYFFGGSEGRLEIGEEEGEDALEVWGEDAPLSEDTSHRLALCNMDWDHVGARDVFG